MQFRKLHTCAYILALPLLLSGFSVAQVTPPVPIDTPTKPPMASPAAESSLDTCLGCHGSFEDLIYATANYSMPSGEKMSPHRYVPHKSKKIPECSNCHKPHPVPPTSKEGWPKPTTDWCYKCHHAGVLVACGDCH